MPQMAPLMWTSLFFMFTGLLLLTMVKIMYSSNTNFMVESEFKPEKNENINLNWKW